MTKSPHMIVFDMDDTLSPSKTRMTDEMGQLLVDLLSLRQVCIISGSRFEQFELQVLNHLHAPQSLLRNLHLMPTCGTRYYRWGQSGWDLLYTEELTLEERTLVKKVLTDAANTLGFWEPRIWGERIEDRGTQVTFSALGQIAPRELKAKWDSEGTKKAKMRQYVADRLPNLEVRSGGSTSIDVTKKGADKAFGVRRLIAANELDVDDVLFIGDSFAEHGNDYPVKAVGVECIEVSNFSETAVLIEKLLPVLRLSDGSVED